MFRCLVQGFYALLTISARHRHDQDVGCHVTHHEKKLNGYKLIVRQCEMDGYAFSYAWPSVPAHVIFAHLQLPKIWPTFGIVRGHPVVPETNNPCLKQPAKHLRGAYECHRSAEGHPQQNETKPGVMSHQRWHLKQYAE